MLNMQRVLVVVAHPDDEVLGCGATIARLVAEGKAVSVLILGEGSSCRFPRALVGSTEVAREIAVRRSFAERCFAVLGVTDVEYGEIPCGRFDTVPVIDIGKMVETHIQAFQPDTLLTHCGHDANSDHRITFNAVITATRPVPGNRIRIVLSFETPSSTEWRFVEVFRPTFFVEVTQYIETKVRAFDCYTPTEGRPFPFPRSETGLMTLARYRGMQVGVPCAEAFEVVRAILTEIPGGAA